MKHSWQRSIAVAALAIFAVLYSSRVAIAASKQTLTGEVGDAMCGSKHMEGAPAECTRTCVAHGSKYALVVGDKIYVLNTTDKAILALLDQQAGKKVTVTGSVDGTTVEVNTAVAAK